MNTVFLVFRVIFTAGLISAAFLGVMLLGYLIIDASLTKHFSFPDTPFLSFLKVYRKTISTRVNRLLHRKKRG